MKLALLAGGLAGLLALAAAPAAAQEPPPDPPVSTSQPTRTWAFSEYRADGTEIGESFFRVGGRLNATESFPASWFDLGEPIDGLNIGRVFSSESGSTYGVYAQSPATGLGQLSDPAHAVGTKSDLEQYQSFRKDSADARLGFKVTAVEVKAVDTNGRRIPRPPECPASFVTCNGVMEGEVRLSVQAYTGAGRRFYQAAGGARVFGWQDHFDFEVFRDSFSTAPFWEERHFDWEPLEAGPPPAFPHGSPTHLAILNLRRPVRFEIDISSVAVGETFTVRTDTFASAYDRRFADGDGRLGSTVSAYLRDPLEIGGDPQLEGTGLTAVPDPLLDTPAPEPDDPAECAAGPDPAAGTVQFGGSAFGVGEWAGAGSQVFVTRTGGRTGAVSATFASTGGTGSAGIDFATVSGTVTFADGDTTPRVVPLEILPDALAEDDETVELALSDPRCTTLGAPSNAVVTIVDDEPDPTFTIGGTIRGLEGGGLVLKNGFDEIAPTNGPFEFPDPQLEGDSYNVTVDTQPAGPVQVCTVTNGTGILADADVTNIDVACVTPAPDDELDPTFGDGGRAVTPGLEGAQAIAVQPDGKIVAASDNALARYDPDGSLDETFGTGGVVPTAIDADTCFPSDAMDLALQPDGRIIVVGVADDGGLEDENVGMQRYDGNGDLDIGFGDQGIVSTDFGGTRDCAYGVAVQDDSKIVVVGEANGVDVAVARYDTAGLPDPSFGPGGAGHVITDVGGEVDVATDVVIDANDNVVVAARVSEDSSLENFAILRFTPAGTVDTTFAGTGSTDIAAGNAEGIAIDAGGRIVVAGSVQSGFSTGKRDVALWRFAPVATPTPVSMATGWSRPTSPRRSVPCRTTSPDTTSPCSPTARSSSSPRPSSTSAPTWPSCATTTAEASISGSATKAC